jgi:hypothetical protein
MRRLVALTAAVAALAFALAAGVALAKQTADFSFKSSGKAVQPGAVEGTGAPGTYEDFPFTIAPDDQDGTATVGIQWGSPADDFDLYVYKKNSSGGLDQVASSAQGTTTEEQAVISSQNGPIEAGAYVIRVQNYASTNPDFTGTVKFGPYTPPNQPPKARLKAPKRAVAGRSVKLDASRSSDADGKIVKYGYDLDGNGSIETFAGARAVFHHKFKAGIHHISLRVTDDKGARAYAAATITVAKPAKKKKR